MKPYAYFGSYNSDKSHQDGVKELSDALETYNMKILGYHTPVGGLKNRTVICFSHQSLMDAAADARKDIATLGTVLRASVSEGEITVTVPAYWVHAYMGDEISTDLLNEIFEQVQKAVNSLQISSNQEKPQYFGHKKGFSVKELKKYHYMMGMPYLEDFVTVGKFKDHDTAVVAITKASEANVSPQTVVYQQSIQRKNSLVTVMGIAMEDGKGGEGTFFPVLDEAVGSPLRSCALPYEIFIQSDGKVITCHGRFRIALAFPDLKMKTFAKIMSAPGNVEKCMKALCKSANA